MTNIPEIELLIRKLAGRDRLDAPEREILADAPMEPLSYDARATIVRAGTPLDRSMLLIEGLVCRYTDMADGSRIILEIHVPGDFIDLQGFLLKRLEHNMAALAPVRIAAVPHDWLRKVTEHWPHLTRMLWFTTLVDAAVHRQWIVSNGRRSAVARIAHLFCELRVRLEITGLADRAGYALPITQGDLADATGLTSIHVNRMLKSLRDDGVASFRDGRVVIHDLDRLERIGEFDPTYLFLDNQPR